MTIAWRVEVMNIGQAAVATGVSAKRIRYYEQIGLVQSAARSESGYRVYDQQDIHALRFVHRARSLGFSLAEIETLLALWHDSKRSSADVKAVALAHVEELQTKIAEMQSMADTLLELANRCDGGARPNCPILKELEGENL
jgi:MerR family copper efflux transcriptional regulator